MFGNDQCLLGLRELDSIVIQHYTLVPVILLRGLEYIRQAPSRGRKIRDLVPIATMAHPQLTTLDLVIEEQLTIESFEVIVALENAVPRKLSNATQDKFDLREFIGAVSERLITRSQEDPGRKYYRVVVVSPSFWS